MWFLLLLLLRAYFRSMELRKVWDHWKGERLLLANVLWNDSRRDSDASNGDVIQNWPKSKCSCHCILILTVHLSETEMGREKSTESEQREENEKREEENTEEVISIWLDENERVTWSARTANIDWVRPLMGFVDQRTYRSRTGRSWLLIVKVRVDVWQRSIGLNGSSTLMTGIHDGGDIAAMSPSFLAQRGPTNSKSDAILYYLYHPFLSQQPMELQCKSLFVHTELRREMPSEKHRQLSESSSKRSSLVFGLTFGRAVCSSDKCVDVARMNASSMSPSTIS